MITYGSTTLTSYNSIVKTEVYYYKSTSATSLSGGSWATTKPTWENGKYIWQKIRTIYEDGTHSESDPVNITGQQGATGTAAYSYKLNASDTIITKSEKGEYSVSKIIFTATYKQGTNAITSYSGRFKIETTNDGITWTTVYPTSGTGVNESSKEFTIPDNILSIRCSLYQAGGLSILLDQMTIPIINDGVGTIDPPYKQVEWVESTGKQYVYLDWKPQIKTWGFEVDFMNQNAVNTTAGGWNESTNKDGYGTIFGVRNSSGVNNVQLSSYNNGLLRIGNGTAITTGFKTDHSRQTIKLHGTTITRVNGTTATVTRVDENTAKPYCNMTVFGLYEGLRRTSTGNIAEPSSTRIYSLKFYDGDTLAVDLVGSIRKADSITGLYDKVSKHFYPAPGMLFGDEVGDIANIDTVAESLNKADVSTTVVNKNRSRMWETSVPFNRLEDGQKITVTYSYGNVVNSTQTSELVGWDDTSSNSNVYLRLIYPDGIKSEWIPCYYSQTARLTTHYGAGTAIDFTYRENLLSNATETTGGSAIVRGFFANASYYQNTSYTQYSNNVKAGTNGIKGYTLIMKDSENTWSCFYSGAYKTTNTGKPVYTGGFILGKILYSAGAGAQTSNSSLDTYYNYKSGVNTSTIYDAYPVDLRYSTNCASTLTTQHPVYIVGTIENDGLFHLDVSQWYTQAEPTYADGKVYVYVGIAYSSYQVWLSTENPAYVYYDGEFILYDKAQTLQNIDSLKTSLETQIDSKVETWCQKTNPASSWTAEERPNHTGDLWYYIGESGTTYKNNTTYQYNGETNVWSAYSANPDLFDKIDGKTAIYYGTTSSVTSAEEGDYLVDSENDCTYRWNNDAWILATDYKQVAIDAIEIGGRNLLRNTSIIRTGTAAKYGLWDILRPTYSSPYALDLDEGEYTFSFDWESSIELPANFYTWIGYGDINGQGKAEMPQNIPAIYTGKDSTSGHYVRTFVWANANDTYPYFACRPFRTSVEDALNDIEFTIKNAKLEKGNKATDWTPAPEDTQADIDQAKNLATAVYGTCSTDAATPLKEVACENFILFDGVRIQVAFENANSTNVPSLNVNNTGAKQILINQAIVSESNQLLWAEDAQMEFVYDGTYWVLQNAPYSLYGICSVTEEIPEKVIECAEAVICKGTTITVDFMYSNTSDNTVFNVANIAQKPLLVNGDVLKVNSRFNWHAGAIRTFYFDGQAWNMSDDIVSAYIDEYETEQNEDGIMVHPVGQKNTGWSIGSTLELLKNGVSYIKMWFDKVEEGEFSLPFIRIGKESGNHVLVGDDAITIREDQKELAHYSSLGITFDDETPYKIGNDTTYIAFEDTDNDAKADALRIVADSISFHSNGTEKDLRSELEGLNENIDLNAQAIEQNAEAIENTQKYIQIDPEVPSIKLATNDRNYLLIESNKLGFWVDANETAYMSQNQMNIPTASITNLLMQTTNAETGETIGQIGWVMRTNGHLSLKIMN